METVKFILINLILPLLVGFLGSWLYPIIKSYLKNRSLSFRKKRIETIKKEYHKFRTYKENYALLTVELIRSLAGKIGLVILFLIIISASILSGIYNEHKDTSLSTSIIVISFFGGYITASFLDVIRQIDVVRKF